MKTKKKEKHSKTRKVLPKQNINLMQFNI